MGTYTRTILQLTILCLAMSIASLAQDSAYLYVVHGITGRDVAATDNPNYPIDILLNNQVCAIKGLVFGATNPPLSLPAGKLDVKISLANTLSPCSNSPLIDDTVSLSANGNVSAVAALNGSGVPSLFTFTDSLAAVTAGDGRLIVAHAADAPGFKLTVTQLGVKDPITHTYTENPGKETTVNLPAGTYSLLATIGTTAVPLGNVGLSDQTVSLVYVVGTASNNSLTLVVRQIRDVF
jgi:Domain of unknown function (DUF4397)